MKRINCLIIVLILAFFYVGDVGAEACSGEEQININREVANVKVTYEITQEKRMIKSVESVDNSEKEYLFDIIQIDILNITDNLYFEVTNDYEKESNKKTKKYYAKDAKDGIISFISPSTDDIINYQIKVYTSNKTSCSGELQRTIKYKQPKFNYLSNYAICNEIPDYYLCKPYIDFEEDISVLDFMDKAQKEYEKINKKAKDNSNKTNQKWYEAVGDYIVKHKKGFIIGGSVLIVALGTGTVLYIKKRRRDVI